MTVGAVPALPAGERSCVGMEAIADEPGVLELEVVVDWAEVAPGEAVVDVLEVLEEVVELVHPASPRTDAASAISDQLRKRDMNKLSFQTASPVPPRWMTRSERE
jgi:hypothetical protein